MTQIHTIKPAAERKKKKRRSKSIDLSRTRKTKIVQGKSSCPRRIDDNKYIEMSYTQIQYNLHVVY